MKKLFGMLALAACVFAGCKVDSGSGSGDGGSQQPSVTQSDTTYAVVIGMENSDYFGACPGAGLDAKRMNELLGKYTKNITYLTDKKATYKAVTEAMKKGIEKSELFILFYSGHGGSEAFADTGSEEADGRDEFLCLNDRYMRDNDIWAIISKSKGRVHILADCCHSGSIYRSPVLTMTAPLEKKSYRTLKALRDGESFSMLCWSGCPDDTYSYGSSTGGKFTNTLLKYFDANLTYDGLWTKIKADKNLLVYEDSQSTLIGKGFDGKKVFR